MTCTPWPGGCGRWVSRRGASLTTNPLILLMLIGVAAVVVNARRSDHAWSDSFRLYLGLGVVIVVIRVVFRLVFGGVAGGHRAARPARDPAARTGCRGSRCSAR